MAKKPETDALQQADAIREQIATLQGQLADAEKRARLDALMLIKDIQRQYRFNQRELGLLFKFKRRARAE